MLPATPRSLIGFNISATMQEKASITLHLLRPRLQLSSFVEDFFVLFKQGLIILCADGKGVYLTLLNDGSQKHKNWREKYVAVGELNIWKEFLEHVAASLENNRYTDNNKIDFMLKLVDSTDAILSLWRDLLEVWQHLSKCCRCLIHVK